MTVGETEGAGYQVAYNGGNPVAFGFESITAKGDSTKAYTFGSYTDVVNGKADYMVRYFTDYNETNGTYGKFDAWDTQVGNGIDAPTQVGDYYVVAMTANALNAWKTQSGISGTAYDNAEGLVDASTGELAPGVIVVSFEVTPLSLEGAAAFNGADGSDQFTYTSKAQDVEISLNGKPLDYDTDYTVTAVKRGVGTVDFKTGIVDAGTYDLTVHGQKDSAYQGQTAELTVTVDPLNLSEATYYAADIKASTSVDYASNLVYVNGNEVTVADLTRADVAKTNQVAYDLGGVSYGLDQSGFVNFTTNRDSAIKGGYTFNLEPVAGNPNVVADQRGSFKINVVENVIDDFRYGNHLTQGAATEIGGLPGQFDLSKGESYDGSTIAAVSGTTLYAQGEKAGEITVTPLTAAEPGAYGVVARVNVDENYTLGGSVYDEFTVVGGYLDPADVDVTVLFHGVNFDITKGVPYSEQYTGEAVVPAISVSCEGKALVQGTDYTVAYYNAQDKAVESMVDAGDYTVVIELANGYVFKNNASKVVAKFGVTITPRELFAIDVDEPVMNAGNTDGILYTGSEIDPTITGWFYGNDGDPRQIVLDPSWYELHGLSMKSGEFYSPVDSVLEVGAYRVNVVPTDASANYTWDYEAPVDFDVIATAIFSDLAADQWYAGEVAQAAVLGYVNGVGDTNLFMPDNDISRAELAQVMFNMANEPLANDEAEQGSYPTKFTDVPADAWFARPVSWAVDAAVIYGMGDTGTFAPYDNATREQVAMMFYRYAAAQGADVYAAADLSGYADAASVSDWAADAVAWAVEAGIFGQGTNQLRPSDPISRAEVAAMAVRLQPERVAEPMA